MLLTRMELWVLRAVDYRPGTGEQQLAAVAGVDPDAVFEVLRNLEIDGLVRRTTIARTGAVSWRVSRAGVDQLVATPPPRRTPPPKQAFGQLSVFHGLASR